MYASYGTGHALWDVPRDIDGGEVVGLLGRNGVDKTTTLRASSGVNPASEGRISFDDEGIRGLEDFKISKRSVNYTPTDRSMFPFLTVPEALRMGGVTGSGGLMTIEETLEWVPRSEVRAPQVFQDVMG